MASVWLPCAECGDERRFEVPECPEGHGWDCPDLACTTCGAAVSLGPAQQLGSWGGDARHPAA